MRKFVVGLLSIFMILGGLFLSACTGDEISISVSNNEVEIYTNNQAADNYLKATVSITLENSTGNVCAEVASGESVTVPAKVARDRQGRYNLEITAAAEKSGTSRVRVYAEDDPTKEEFITAYVKTFITGVTQSQTITSGDLFAVNGEFVELDPDKFLTFTEAYANVKDIRWGFAENDNKTEFYSGNDLVAEIKDNRFLYVYENCGIIKVSATFTENSQITTTLTFAVIEAANFQTFDFGSENLIGEGEVLKPSTEISLVRNDNNQSQVTGKISVNIGQNTQYNQDAQRITPKIYNKVRGGEKEYIKLEDYFSYESDTNYDPSTGLWTYSYTLNCIDSGQQYTNKYGDFYLEFVFSYSAYNYEFSTSEKTEIAVSTYYIADSLNVYDSTGHDIGTDDVLDNSKAIDLYSSYTNSYGYAVTVKMEPEKALADNTFFISVTDDGKWMGNNPDYYVRIFTLTGSNALDEITWRRADEGANNYVTENIVNGTTLYLRSGLVSTESNFKINFVSSSNTSARTTVTANLYAVNSVDTMVLRDEDNFAYTYEPLYISSSPDEDGHNRSGEIVLRVFGMAYANGLDWEYAPNYGAKDNFDISIDVRAENQELGSGIENTYVLIAIVVNLKASYFDGKVEFILTHRTGMKSENFSVYAFVPLTSASVLNAVNGSSNVYDEVHSEQSFYAVPAERAEEQTDASYRDTIEGREGEYVIYTDSQYQNESLDSIMLTAGTNINLALNFNNASLIKTDSIPNGYQFMFLDMKALYGQYAAINIDDLELPQNFEDLQPEQYQKYLAWFRSLSMVGKVENQLFCPRYLDMFKAGSNSYFRFFDETSLLSLSNLEYTIYVAVLADGYNDKHESVTMIRFFRLESFYPVTSLDSNVDTRDNMYSFESVSYQDESLSYVDVTIQLRTDENIPTYTDRSLFTISLTNGVRYDGNTNTYASVPLVVTDSEGNSRNIERVYNDFVEVRNIRISGKLMTFRIVAMSTQQLSRVQESVSVRYEFKNSVKSANIDLTILQADRVERVIWKNQTVDGEIYIDLTSNENSYILQAAVEPATARNYSLYPIASLLSSKDSSYNIVDMYDLTSDRGQASGQNISITINTDLGAYGYIYLLPEDMIRQNDGTPSVVYYPLSSTEEYGISKQAEYLELNRINDWYNDLVNGTDTVANYFLNNRNERVYYRDIILKIPLVIADGTTEATAIRVYSQDDLKNAVEKPYLYYRVMNDITLTDWENDGVEFSGMIFGNTPDITITFAGNEESNKPEDLCNPLVDTLTGTIKDLTLVGRVGGDGFVATVNSGTVENVIVDVRYKDGRYTYSEIIGRGGYVGSIVGINRGTVRGCFNYGAQVNAGSAVAGGLVGKNCDESQHGSVIGCGVEFYTYQTKTGKISNKLIGGDIGGLVGDSTDANDIIDSSYVYAFSLENYEEGELPIVETSGQIGVFIGRGVASCATIRNSFGYMGRYNLTIGTGDALISESYITYLEDRQDSASGTSVNPVFKFYTAGNGYNGVPENQNVNEERYQTNTANMPSNWMDRNDNGFDESVNFGFSYLRDVRQTENVDVTSQKMRDIDGKLMTDESGKNAVMFYYDTTSILNDRETAELRALNSIAVRDLFPSIQNVRSVLVASSNMAYIDFTTNSITASGVTYRKGGDAFFVTLTIYSRIDFTKSENYNLMVVYSMPDLVAVTQSGLELQTTQVLRIQTGSNNQERVTFVVDNGSVYLAGTEYKLISNEYVFGATFNMPAVEKKDAYKQYIETSLIGNTTTIIAKEATPSNIEATITAEVVELKKAATNEGADVAYKNLNNLILQKLTRVFLISTYNGANNLYTDVSGGVSLVPSERAQFHVYVDTDAADEDLDISITYNDRAYSLTTSTLNGTQSGTVVLDENIGIYVNWTKVGRTNTIDEFLVTVGVINEYLHRVEKVYDITLNIAAKSNPVHKAEVVVSVDKQSIDDVIVNSYLITSRMRHNAIWYYAADESIATTLTPGSDAIMSVELDKRYSHITHFTVAAEVTGGGSAMLSRVMLDSVYGYYASSATTSYDASTRVLTVIPSQNDLVNGLYYFRLYISSDFVGVGSVALTFNFYDESGVVKISQYSYAVTYFNSATIKIGDGTTAVLPKGGSVDVTITLLEGQTFEDINVENVNGVRFDIVSETEEIGATIISARLSAGFGATLADGTRCGEFKINISISRVVNGVREPQIITSASIFLVDFAIDGNATRLRDTGNTIQDNTIGDITGNRTGVFDVYYTYIGTDASNLTFEYKFNPEQYNYSSNEQEVVDALMNERNKFLDNGTYMADGYPYYINYNYDIYTGTYTEIEMEDRLYYINRDGSFSSVHSAVTDRFTENQYVEFEKIDGDGIKVSGLSQGAVYLRLVTTVVVGEVVFRYNYDFAIVVEVYTDEEVPFPIYNADQFLRYLDGVESPGQVAGQAENYILMNDIVLNNYTPRATDLFASLDGNGYVIYINSFAMPETNSLHLALFSEVAENTLIKNVIVNVYNAGQITANVNTYSAGVEIAGFANTNKGIIYNSHVVAFYNSQIPGSSNIVGDVGLVVKYVTGDGFAPVKLDSTAYSDLTIFNVAGFVNTNEGYITNSRVGGASVARMATIDNEDYKFDTALPTFTICGQGVVSGFVYDNTSAIAASYASDVSIYNEMDSTASQTAGFVNSNSGSIQTSYTAGRKPETSGGVFYRNITKIQASGYVGGFVYYNNGQIKNSYVNIALEIETNRSSLAAGFVYHNGDSGEINLCYSAVEMTNKSIDEMSFIGVSVSGDSVLNDNDAGGIEYSYYYSTERVDNTAQSGYRVGAYAITDVNEQETFYRFSFVSENGLVDGIWYIDDDFVSLASADDVAFSHRTIRYTSDEAYVYTYTTTLKDYTTGRMPDFRYGSENNPIIIRNAVDFAKAMGESKENYEISSYKQFYTQNEVYGYYRFVKDIDFSEILIKKTSETQNVGENDYLLTTTTKKFSGTIDGNGFTIENIELGDNTATENYGMFAQLDGGTIMSLDLVVAGVRNSSANMVGLIAGSAIDSTLVAISISPLETQSDDSELIESAVSIQGQNIVGGLVGALIGDSKLSDITITDIDVQTAYYTNRDATEEDLNSKDNAARIRTAVKDRASITTIAGNMSYAGGVVGYVDVYDERDSEFVKYSSGYTIVNYDIVTIRVLSSVKVYAEVAGGAFGYIGENTMIYDVGVEIGTTDDNDKSYITAINLYAGGLVGESYGGIYASYAQYGREIQSQIEDNMISGASATGGSVGQTSIFSYTQNDTTYLGVRLNNPLYIGGLVGYAGSGYIRDSYSKLNVVSNEIFPNGDTYYNSRTKQIGGIVGAIDSSEDYSYYATYIESMPSVSYYIGEVYYSGVLASYHDKAYTSSSIVTATGNSYVGGVVGGMKESTGLVLDLVNSVPYFDISLDKTALDNTSAIVGIVRNNKLGSTPRLYITGEENRIAEVISDTAASVGKSSVGVAVDMLKSVYRTDETGDNRTSFMAKVEIQGGNQDKNLEIEGLTFDIQTLPNYTDRTNAYSGMYDKFLMMDWDPDVWEHLETMVFPEIMLVPQLSVYYLDATTESINGMLRAIQNNPFITVVVRGRTDVNDKNSIHTDVNLQTISAISNFFGKFMSYEAYSKDREEGVVQATVEYGGRLNENVGILIARPIFSQSEFSISSLNIYFVPNPGSYTATGSESSILVSGSANNSEFTNLNIYIRKVVTGAEDANKLYLHPIDDGGNDETRQGYAGMIAPTALDSSFAGMQYYFDEGMEVIFARGQNITSYASLSFGLNAGRVLLESRYSDVEVGETGITSLASGSDGHPKTITFTVDLEGLTCPTLYFGIVAGYVGYNKNDPDLANVMVNIGSLNKGFDNTKIIIQKGNGVSDASEVIDDLYLGGYFGYTKHFALLTTSIVGGPEIEYVRNLNIYQHINVKNAYIGLIAGAMDSSASGSGSSTFANGNLDLISFTGKIYQPNNITVETAHIGGIAGVNKIAFNATLNFKVDLSVVGSYASESSAYQHDATNTDIYNSIFNNNYMKNWSETPSVGDANESAAIENGVKYSFVYKKQVYAGWIFGENTARITATSENNSKKSILTGDMLFYRTKDEDSTYKDNGTPTAAIGAIGLVSAVATIESSLYVDASMNIFSYVGRTGGNANIGGFIGGFTEKSSIIVSNFLYNGDVVVGADDIYFGGTIGLAQVSSRFSMTNDIYGGNLRVFTEYNDSQKQKLIVGGIAGQIDEPTLGGNTISGCYTYGNVYVYYNHETLLETYYYGGIVGSVITSQAVESTSGGSNRLAVIDCITLMTSFNDMVTETLVSNSKTVNYRVNAIVGNNYEALDYSQNKYSSGVNLANQPALHTLPYNTEEGQEGNYTNEDVNQNKDLPYGTLESGNAFYGYSPSAYALGSSSTNIVDELVSALNGRIEVSVVPKLNPVKLTNVSYNNTTGKGKATIDALGLSDSSSTFTNGSGTDIKWYYIAGDLKLDRFAVEANGDWRNVLNNIVIVGNGRTITYVDDERTGENGYTADDGDQFGLIKNFGGSISSVDGNGYEYTINVLSGLLFNVNIDLDIMDGSGNNKIFGILNTFGGVSNSLGRYSTDILYASGAIGNISIGGTAHVDIGGLIGRMYQGLVSNCYTDLDIIYRAVKQNTESNECGYVSSFIGTNTQPGYYADIINSFAMGRMKAYASVKLNAFTYNMTIGNTGEWRVFDSYTATDVDESINYGEGVAKLVKYRGTESGKGTNYGSTIEKFSLDYRLAENNGIEPYQMSINAKAVSTTHRINDSIECNPSNDSKNTSTSYWFFSPYRNYGYATTGFGYLRNISVYRREKVSTGEDDSSEMAYTEYRYSRLSVEEVEKLFDENKGYTDFYSAIINEELLIGAVELSASTFQSRGGYGSTVDINRNNKFFLTTNLDYTNKCTWTKAYSAIASNTKANPFYLDGCDHIVIIKSSVSMFKEICGDIENFNLINEDTVKTSASVDDSNEFVIYSILAEKMIGNLTNVTVEGKINVENSTNKTQLDGGIVGIMKGNMKSVDSLVNITLSSAYGCYVGGLASVLINGEISYSSNAGNILIRDGKSTTAKAVEDIQLNFPENATQGVPKIIVTEQATSLSLNLNEPSTVITADDGKKFYEVDADVEPPLEMNSVAGGLVGYAKSATNSINNSYNTGSIINNDTSKAKNIKLVTGGLVGYSEIAIRQSFNQGYVTTGYKDNLGTAVSGGIAGYTTGFGTMADVINSGKVEAISYVNKDNYSIKTSLSKKNDSDSLPVITVTIVYNEENSIRTVYAYALGYYDGVDKEEEGPYINGNNENSDVVIDGNVGKYEIVMQYNMKAPHYTDPDGNYVIEELYDYNVGDGEKPLVKISGYDAYGFPNRLNYYYTYTLNYPNWKFIDIQDQGSYIYGGPGWTNGEPSRENGAENIYWSKRNDKNGGSGLLEFHINDYENFVFNRGTDGKGYREKDNGFEEINTNMENMTPGGTTEYYFSLPFFYRAGDENNAFFNTADGAKGQFTQSLTTEALSSLESVKINELFDNCEIAYDEIITALCGYSSNVVSGTYGNKTVKDLYNDIATKKQTSNNNEEVVNINGKSYSLVENEAQLSKYVSDLEFEVSFDVILPNIEGAEISINPKNCVKDLKFTIFYKDGENLIPLKLGDKDQFIEPNGSRMISAENSNENPNIYQFKFKVFYTESELVAAVNKAVPGLDVSTIENFYISVSYTANYNIKSIVEIVKDNVAVVDGVAYILYYKDGVEVEGGFTTLPGLASGFDSPAIKDVIVYLDADVLYDSESRTSAGYNVSIEENELSDYYGRMAISNENMDELAFNKFVKTLDQKSLGLKYSYYVTEGKDLEISRGNADLSTTSITVTPINAQSIVEVTGYKMDHTEKQGVLDVGSLLSKELVGDFDKLVVNIGANNISDIITFAFNKDGTFEKGYNEANTDGTYIRGWNLTNVNDTIRVEYQEDSNKILFTYEGATVPPAFAEYFENKGTGSNIRIYKTSGVIRYQEELKIGTPGARIPINIYQRGNVSVDVEVSSIESINPVAKAELNASGDGYTFSSSIYLRNIPIKYSVEKMTIKIGMEGYTIISSGFGNISYTPTFFSVDETAPVSATHQVYVTSDYKLYYAQNVFDLEFGEDLIFATLLSISDPPEYTTEFKEISNFKESDDMVVRSLYSKGGILGDSDKIIAITKQYNNNLKLQVTKYVIKNGNTIKNSYTSYKLGELQSHRIDVQEVEMQTPNVGDLDVGDIADDLMNSVTGNMKFETHVYNTVAEKSYYLVDNENNNYVVYVKTNSKADPAIDEYFCQKVDPQGYDIGKEYYSEAFATLPTICIEITGRENEGDSNGENRDNVANKFKEIENLTYVKYTLNRPLLFREEIIKSKDSEGKTTTEYTTKENTVNNPIVYVMYENAEITVSRSVAEKFAPEYYQYYKEEFDPTSKNYKGDSSEPYQVSSFTNNMGEFSQTISQGNQMTTIKIDIKGEMTKSVATLNDKGEYEKGPDQVSVVQTFNEDVSGKRHTFSASGVHKYTDSKGVEHTYTALGRDENGNECVQHTYKDSSGNHIFVTYKAGEFEVFKDVEGAQQEVVNDSIELSKNETLVVSNVGGIESFDLIGTTTDFRASMTNMFVDISNFAYTITDLTIELTNKYTLRYDESGIINLATERGVINYHDEVGISTDADEYADKDAGVIYENDNMRYDYIYGTLNTGGDDSDISNIIRDTYGLPLKLYCRQSTENHIYFSLTETKSTNGENVSTHNSFVNGVLNVTDEGENDYLDNLDVVRTLQNGDRVESLVIDVASKLDRIKYGGNYYTVIASVSSLIQAENIESTWSNSKEKKLGAQSQKYVILIDNIFMTNTVSNADSKIYGDNYIIFEYASLSEKKPAVRVDSVGNGISGKIVNTRFCFVLEAAQLNETTEVSNNDRSIFIVNKYDDNDASVENIRMYGSAQNIDPNYSLKFSIVSSDTANIRLPGIISYVSLIGRNADNVANYSKNKLDGNDVRVNLLEVTETIKEISGDSKSIFVSGDGSNGANGVDASTFSNNGKNGGTAGKAGTISVVDSKTSIVLGGASGVAGSGGNGAHGANATYSSVAEGGGAGGNYGSMPTTGENVFRRNRNYETQKRLAGSGGTGGLGYVGLLGENGSDVVLDRGQNYGYGGSVGSKSVYMTAAGGGASGLFEGITQASGEDGKDFVAAKNSVSDGYEHYAMYYWSNNSERLFGNLQMIPTFTYSNDYTVLSMNGKLSGSSDGRVVSTGLYGSNHDALTYALAKVFGSPNRDFMKNTHDIVYYGFYGAIFAVTAWFNPKAWYIVPICVVGLAEAIAGLKDSMVRYGYTQYGEIHAEYDFPGNLFYPLPTLINGHFCNPCQVGYGDHFEAWLVDYQNTWNKYFVGGQGGYGYVQIDTNYEVKDGIESYNTVIQNSGVDSTEYRISSTVLIGNKEQSCYINNDRKVQIAGENKTYDIKSKTEPFDYVVVNGQRFLCSMVDEDGESKEVVKYYDSTSYVTTSDGKKTVEIADTIYNVLTDDGAYNYITLESGEDVKIDSTISSVGKNYNVYINEDGKAIVKFDQDGVIVDTPLTLGIVENQDYKYIKYSDVEYRVDKNKNQVNINGKVYNVNEGVVTIPTNYKIETKRSAGRLSYFIKFNGKEVTVTLNSDSTVTTTTAGINGPYTVAIHGGTPWTRNIYGYYSAYSGGLSEFMSRDDVVTKAGMYGETRNLIALK